MGSQASRLVLFRLCMRVLVLRGLSTSFQLVRCILPPVRVALFPPADLFHIRMLMRQLSAFSPQPKRCLNQPVMPFQVRTVIRHQRSRTSAEKRASNHASKA